MELEIQLDEIKEQYNNVIRNSNSKAQQKKMVFLERNLEQLTIVQKQLVDQNSALKKEAGIAERKLLARNERIHNLEALLQDADRRLVAQNHKFEARLQSVMQLLEEARGTYSFCGKQDHRTPIPRFFVTFSFYSQCSKQTVWGSIPELRTDREATAGRWGSDTHTITGHWAGILLV